MGIKGGHSLTYSIKINNLTTLYNILSQYNSASSTQLKDNLRPRYLRIFLEYRPGDAQTGHLRNIRTTFFLTRDK